MGFSFKKALRFAGKIAKPLLQTTPIGQAALKAQQTLKGLAVNVRAARTKIQPASVRASIDKRIHMAPKRLALPVGIMPSTAMEKRTALPGGAPLSKPRKRRRLPRFQDADTREEADAILARLKRKKGQKASGSKRKAPTGGKDFKALSASWRAAGKPGTWLGWVKSH